MPAVTYLRDIVSSSSRTTAIFKNAARLAARRSQKEIEHDRLRNKDSRLWDFNIPLTNLKRSAKSNRHAPGLRGVSEIDRHASDFQPGIKFDTKYVGVEVPAIPAPNIWSKSSFAQYVHDLCQSQMPHQLGKGSKHQETVLQWLEHKLFIPENAHLVTPEALNSAIKFLYKLEKVPSVWKLYAYAQRIEPQLSYGIADTMLRNAAVKRDGLVFTSLLDKALLSGFVPTEKTWTSFLMCLQDDKAYRLVIKAMEEHGLMTAEETRQDVAVRKLDLILSENPLLLKNISELESQMDIQVGKDWLTIRSANALLRRLCELPAVQPIVDFVDMVAARGCKLNLDSMNLLLLRHDRCTDLGTALQVLACFINHNSIVPDQTSYALLFGTAWKLRYANSCKILWTAACLHGRVTQSVTSRLLESMVLLPDSSKTAARMWKWQAGRLIPGIDPENPTSQKEDRGFDSHHRQDSIALLENDRSLYQRYNYPLQTVLRQLADAYKLDQSWRMTGEHTQPIEKLQKSMIKPLLQPVAET